MSADIEWKTTSREMNKIAEIKEEPRKKLTDPLNSIHYNVVWE